ncbi:MAG: AMP-binding protein, partial [Gillisia sp.]
SKAVKLQEKSGISVIPTASFFSQAFIQNPDITLEKFEIAEDHPIFIFYTSGTTGKPKGVLYTNRMLFWNSLNTSVQLEITSKDHTINALPPYHTSGWNVLLLPMLHRGARVDFMKKFRPKKLLQYIEEEPVSLFLAVPTMLRMMVKTSAFHDFIPKKLKYIVVGGESLSVSLIDTWAKKGILISQGYGLTEAGPSITSLHYHDALWKKGSIGKANFYVDYKIVDKNNVEVIAHQPGELCLRGNIVTPGYWNDLDHSFSKIRDNWFHTEDLVKVDDDGFIYIVGRKSQMFISGGENIHPAEIEQVFYKYPQVREAAVVAVENENWGEMGIAFIVLNEGKFQSVALMEHLKMHLAAYKIPKDIIYLKSLPKVGIGKIDKKELRRIYININDDKRNSM